MLRVRADDRPSRSAWDAFVATFWLVTFWLLDFGMSRPPSSPARRVAPDSTCFPAVEHAEQPVERSHQHSTDTRPSSRQRAHAGDEPGGPPGTLRVAADSDKHWDSWIARRVAWC